MSEYTVPMDSLVATIVSRLDDGQREDFEERSAIMEYDAQLPRGHAECLALLDVLQRYPAILSGVSVLQAVHDGTTQWLLTTDLNYARQQLAAIGGTDLGNVNLADVIREQYGGMALLTTGG